MMMLANEPLAKYTAARLGGPAEWLYIARDSVDDLVQVVTDAWAKDMPVHILGGGANVLISDRGVPGLVVINRISQIEFGNWHEGRSVAVSSGTGLSTLANRCQLRGLAGMEWAVSVPGTVGGAIVNNAGAHGADMADSLGDVVVLEPDGPHLYSLAEMQYDYRHSVLKARKDRRFLVLLATLRLPEDDPAEIKARMQANIAYRKRTQPPGASLGSIFKNPPGDYAGRLIEAAGLKGMQIGGAMVSPVHANFFINTGADTCAEDYYRLIRYVQSSVHHYNGVWLEPEIELVGPW